MIVFNLKSACSHAQSRPHWLASGFRSFWQKNSLIFCLGDNSFSNYFKIERPSLAGPIRSVKSELHTQCRNYFSKTLLTSEQSFLIGGGRKNNSEITLKTDNCGVNSVQKCKTRRMFSCFALVSGRTREIRDEF